MKLKLTAALLIFALTLPGQDKNFFPKPSYFRETFATPRSKVELLPPVKISDYVVAGKLELSLRQYLELVMANNTDVQISRLSLETSKNSILRGHSRFDPQASANFNSTRSKQLPSDLLAGASTLQTLTQPLQLGYSQTLMNGTSYSVNFSEQKFTTNSRNATFNPSFNNSLSINLTQPLLRDRGSFINRAPIMLAESRLRKSEYDLKTTLIGLISAAELAYWEAVQRRENLKVQENALSVADEFRKRSKRELELGAISRLDIYDPELRFVQAQASVAQARYVILQQDDVLRKQIGADLDPALRTLPIELTESPTPPAASGPPDPEPLIAKAISMRPELKSSQQNLDVDDLQIRQASNALRPDLALTGIYTTQGRGGTGFTRTNVFDSDLGTESLITRVIPGGYGDAFTQMFGFGYPVYGFGLRLRLPIKNRAASADMADALISKKRDAYAIRGVEQQIRLDVLNAINQIEASKTSIELAIQSRDFAKLRFDAEDQKYKLGTSLQYLVLDAQGSLNQAESNVVNQLVNYHRNVLSLLRATGDLLEERGVAIK